MKKVLIVGIVTLIGAGGFWVQTQSNQQTLCIEDWLDNTQDLFQSAVAYFENMPEQPAVDESESFDDAMEALLPEQQTTPAPKQDDNAASDEPERTAINWEYRPVHNLDAASDEPKKALLPNLFISEHNRTKPALKGLLHMDESDNIVGAEVGVEIPTNL